LDDDQDGGFDECFFWYRLTRVVPAKDCKTIVVVCCVLELFHVVPGPLKQKLRIIGAGFWRADDLPVAQPTLPTLSKQ